MPNSYTDVIYSDRGGTRDFIRRAARGWSMFMHMRDESLDAPLRYPKLSEYVLKSYREAFDELKAWSDMSEEGKRVAYDKYVEEMREAKEKAEARRSAMRERYNKAIFDIQQIEVKSEGMKKFKEYMLDMLAESKKFDCPDPSWYYEVPDFETWKDSRSEALAKNLNYRVDELARDRSNIAKQIAWIDEFAATFGIEVEPPV